jgi:hypothetical protein
VFLPCHVRVILPVDWVPRSCNLRCSCAVWALGSLASIPARPETGSPGTVEVAAASSLTQPLLEAEAFCIVLPTIPSDAAVFLLLFLAQGPLHYVTLAFPRTVLRTDCIFFTENVALCCMEGVFGSMDWLVAFLSFVFGIQFRSLAAHRCKDQVPNPKKIFLSIQKYFNLAHSSCKKKR